MPEETIPLLFDTDIGSDIDDAVCLAYLLRQPRCDLLGITTVSGEPRARAALADAVCQAAGRPDLPIRAGNDVGINRGIVQPACPQAAVLPRFPHRAPDSFEPYTAVAFLREQILARPGELTLLAVGPLTNLALLFTLDPTVPAKLKRLVLMGGLFGWNVPGTPREWNILCDPLAAAIVFRAPVPELVAIGLDVTTQCRLPTADCVARFRQAGGPLAVVAAATEIWGRHASHVTFHDPLAGSVVFHPELCRYAAGRIEVETQSERLAGATLFNPNAPDKPHQIAHAVDAQAFFEDYFNVVSKTQPQQGFHSRRSEAQQMRN
jgi:inosine-uridine nucleoside N-ribohydrolase